MINLIKDEIWDVVLEKNQENKYRFVFRHLDSIEITTSYLTFNKEELLISRKVLRDISKEIKTGKLKSKYDSFILLEDQSGQFIVSIELMDYHNFKFTLINYSSEFSMHLHGHSFELEKLTTSLDLIEVL